MLTSGYGRLRLPSPEARNGVVTPLGGTHPELKARSQLCLSGNTSRRPILIQSSSNNGADSDALSVLGQFEIAGGGGAEAAQNNTLDSGGNPVTPAGKPLVEASANVGLGHFFATGSAAKVLAQGFAANMGYQERGALQVVNDTAWVSEGDLKATIPVTANDVGLAGEVKIRVVGKPRVGSVEEPITDNRIVYKFDKDKWEADGKPGMDTITYEVTDSAGRRGIALVTIVIKGGKAGVVADNTETPQPIAANGDTSTNAPLTDVGQSTLPQLGEGDS